MFPAPQWCEVFSGVLATVVDRSRSILDGGGFARRCGGGGEGVCRGASGSTGGGPRGCLEVPLLTSSGGTGVRGCRKVGLGATGEELASVGG